MMESVGVADFRAGLRGEPVHRYEQLTSADRWRESVHETAKAVLAGDWRWKGRPSVAVIPPVDWDGLCGDDRSWSLALHAWEALAALLTTYDHTEDSTCLDLAVDLAVDWLERFPVVDDAHPFAWYDMAVGSRAYRLAYILDVVAHDADRDDVLVGRLLDGLLLHAAALADDQRFAHYSNHGLYQVMGQLAIARRFQALPEARAAGVQGRHRLDSLLDSQFTEEGVHREHSPHYHDLVLIPLRALQIAGLIRDPSLEERCEHFEEALAWFVTPASRYAMFGDTSRQHVGAQRVDDLVSPSLKFCLSSGRVGSPPSGRTKAFPESGYVIFRDEWPTGKHDFGDGSYLAQTCAFHSRIHKHADDLSFVWYDRGCDILTDAGRYGYVGKTRSDSDLYARGFWYSDPRRIYVESTRSHNTVEVDCQSIPRRGVEPYGSALTQWGERGDIRFSESRIAHHGVVHTRLLLFLPRTWLIVVDSLAGSEGDEHDFVQRFHLAPELDLVRDERPGGDVFSAALSSKDRLQVVALLPNASVMPARGVKEPDLLGWISPGDRVIEPQWTFGWTVEGRSSAIFASLFCFAEEAPAVDRSRTEIDREATSGQLSWEVAGGRHSVGFARTPGRSFDATYFSLS